MKFTKVEQDCDQIWVYCHDENESFRASISINGQGGGHITVDQLNHLGDDLCETDVSCCLATQMLKHASIMVTSIEHAGWLEEDGDNLGYGHWKFKYQLKPIAEVLGNSEENMDVFTYTPDMTHPTCVNCGDKVIVPDCDPTMPWKGVCLSGHEATYQLIENTECMDLANLYKLWDQLSLVPVNDDGEIEGSFLHFSTGIDREEIWDWFEEQNPAFIAGEAISGIRHNS